MSGIVKLIKVAAALSFLCGSTQTAFIDPGPLLAVHQHAIRCEGVHIGRGRGRRHMMHWDGQGTGYERDYGFLVATGEEVVVRVLVVGVEGLFRVTGEGGLEHDGLGRLGGVHET